MAPKNGNTQATRSTALSMDNLGEISFLQMAATKPSGMLGNP
jgi:hypothetical protein